MIEDEVKALRKEVEDLRDVVFSLKARQGRPDQPLRSSYIPSSIPIDDVDYKRIGMIYQSSVPTTSFMGDVDTEIGKYIVSSYLKWAMQKQLEDRS